MVSKHLFQNRGSLSTASTKVCAFAVTHRYPWAPIAAGGLLVERSGFSLGDWLSQTKESEQKARLLKRHPGFLPPKVHCCLTPMVFQHLTTFVEFVRIPHQQGDKEHTDT